MASDPAAPSDLIERLRQLEAEVVRLNEQLARRDENGGAGSVAAAWIGFEEAPEQSEAGAAEAELIRRITVIAGLSNADIAAMGFAPMTAEIGAILGDPIFNDWPVERQRPVIRRVTEIYTGHWQANGRSLIPPLEALFHRAAASADADVEVLCEYYQLLYFLYFVSAARPSDTKGFADNVVARFSAAVRGDGARGLPSRALAEGPRRVGYLAQFAHGTRDAVGQFAHHLLEGLKRYFPDRYAPILYAWSEWADEAVGRFEEARVPVRRFGPMAMAERLQAVEAAIAEDQIDILITDQNTWLPAVLFERRAAPVQIYYLVGGLPYWPLANIDAVFRIDVYDPRLDGFDPAICFPMGLGPWDIDALTPPVDKARITAERARFPAGKRLIGNYGRLTKITDGFLAIAAELLQRHDDVIVVIGGTGDGNSIRQFIDAHGLAGRLVLIDDYVDGHVWGHILEVFLDTFPIEGGVSRREMMAKGRPVVTMSGPWSAVEATPPLVARDRAAYLDIVSSLLDDPAFYEEACAATREFIAACMTELDYAAAVDDALTIIAGRRAEPLLEADANNGLDTCTEQTARSKHPPLTAETLCYGSMLAMLRQEAPSRIRQVAFEAADTLLETAFADDVLYLPDLHLQLWRGCVVPSETDTTDYALHDLRDFVGNGKISLPGSRIDCQVIDEDTFVASNLYSVNFYHFSEILYQVMILERSGFRGLYILAETDGPMSPVVRPLPTFQRELLLLLGIAPERIANVSSPTLLRSAYFATRVAHTDIARYPALFRTVRDTLRAAVSTDRSKGRRLWLKRGRYRGLVNADEVYACVERYGFDLLDMSHLPVAEQIAAAQGADLLGGAHGAAMLHAMFAGEGASIIECFSPHYLNPCVLQICRLLNHRYYQLVGSNSPLRPYRHGVDVEIDLDQLVPLLDRICA